MKTLYCAQSLSLYGIKPLTGEADAYGRRVLCDLSNDGITLLTAYFGLSHTVEAKHAFAANWNGWVDDDKAVASVLLARSVLEDLKVFALLHVGRYDYVMETPNGPVGFNAEETYGQQYLRADLPAGYHLLTNASKHSAAPQVNGRNVHAMSGRVL